MVTTRKKNNKAVLKPSTNNKKQKTRNTKAKAASNKNANDDVPHLATRVVLAVPPAANAVAATVATEQPPHPSWMELLGVRRCELIVNNTVILLYSSNVLLLCPFSFPLQPNPTPATVSAVYAALAAGSASTTTPQAAAVAGSIVDPAALLVPLNQANQSYVHAAVSAPFVHCRRWHVSVAPSSSFDTGPPPSSSPAADAVAVWFSSRRRSSPSFWVANGNARRSSSTNRSVCSCRSGRAFRGSPGRVV
jgi:hypothetical protein